MLPSWCADTITVMRPALVTSRGTVVPDWTNATVTTITGCSVQTGVTSEDRDGRTATLLGGTLYLPPTADVRAGDRVQFGGSTYEVQGVPMAWRSPTGRVSHIQARIAEWRG